MEVCPVEVAVSVLGGTWKLTLVKHLSEGSRRFGELGRLVPLANRKTLTRQLRELEEDGIVERVVHAEVPPKVVYSLAEFGRGLAPVVSVMNAWGEYFADQHSASSPLDDVPQPGRVAR